MFSASDENTHAAVDARVLRDIPADVPSQDFTNKGLILARTAALSRSAYFARFTRTVGLPPMEYLLAWRMAIAKDLLRREDVAVADVAERVGYRSGSTFSTAFSRHVAALQVATHASLGAPDGLTVTYKERLPEPHISTNSGTLAVHPSWT